MITHNPHSFQWGFILEESTKDFLMNGWKNYETWNVTLWIQNDEPLYRLALASAGFQSFMNQLIEWGNKEDVNSIKASIPHMYTMTDPTIGAINNIMDTKMYYNERKSEELHERIHNFRDFMILAIVLSVVMSICASFSRRCR